MLFLLVGCKESNSVKESKGTISNITCDKAIDMQGDGAIIVDVREKEEYMQEHLDDAINKYTEAMKIAKECSEKLDNATKAVNKILNENNELEDFKEMEVKE